MRKTAASRNRHGAKRHRSCLHSPLSRHLANRSRNYVDARKHCPHAASTAKIRANVVRAVTPPFGIRTLINFTLSLLIKRGWWNATLLTKHKKGKQTFIQKQQHPTSRRALFLVGRFVGTRDFHHLGPQVGMCIREVHHARKCRSLV